MSRNYNLAIYKNKLLTFMLWGILFFILWLNVWLIYFSLTCLWLFYVFAIGFLLSSLYYATDKNKRKPTFSFIFGLFLMLGYSVYVFGHFLEGWEAAKWLVYGLDLITASMAFFPSCRRNTGGRKGTRYLKKWHLEIILFLFFVLSSYLLLSVLGKRKDVFSVLNNYFVLAFLIGGVSVAAIKLYTQFLDFKNNLSTLTEQKFSQSRPAFSKIDFDAMHEKVEAYFNTSMDFTSPDFNTKDLSEALAVSQKELSQYIGYFRATNFYRLLGEYRIEYVIKDMQEKPYYTLDAIMLDAGFRSRPSFIKHFKRAKGCVPSEYKKQIK